MALLNSNTPTNFRWVLAGMPQDVAAVAFATVNPVLATAIEEVGRNPRHVRKLSTDTAVEAVSHLDDPAVISAVIAAESRVVVADCAKARLRALAASAAGPERNERNIIERTARAVARQVGEVPDALGALKSIHQQTFADWLDSLPVGELVVAFPNLFATAELRRVVAASTVLFASALQSADVDQAQAMAQSASLSKGFLMRVFKEHQGPWTLPFAIAAAHTFSGVETKPVQAAVVSPEGLTYWRTISRLDLLVWAGAAGENEIVDALTKKGDPRQNLLLAARRPQDAELIIDTLWNAGKLPVWTPSNGSQFSACRAPFDIAGLADDALFRMLCQTAPPVRSDWLAGRFVNKPTRELVRRLAVDVPASGLVQSLQHSVAASQQAAIWLLDDMCELSKGSANAVKMLMSSRSEWVRDRIAESLAEKLGTNESAWAMFWQLFKNAGELTFNELLGVCSTLGSDT